MIFQNSHSSPTHFYKLLQQQENIVITKIEKWAKMMAFFNQQAFDPTKGLNDVKVYMAYLEQYKKVSKDGKVGYYDRYKNGVDRSDIELVKHKKFLTCTGKKWLIK